ncbi:MAG: SIS domain-containing protein [candidate division Zixibacteria bacterium]|nr:SIS domain-containing protein [candidate division Zixibacteria bacterium]
MNPDDILKRAIEGHREVLENLGGRFFDSVSAASRAIIEAFENGGRLYACGNGGSAADAQHIVTEFVVRLDSGDKREALPATALTTNTSLLTAASNDIGFESVFRRQLEAFGRSGDILLAVSTSGNSGNVIRAVELAREKGITSIGLLGSGGGELKPLVDIDITIPSNNTQRIQEMHILAGHIICEIVTTHLRSKA